MIWKWCCLLWCSLALVVGAQTPLPRAHSHNDYEHTRPLQDALAEGFCSVEADIWPVGGSLLVAHHRKDLQPERTLEALYLAPLKQRIQAHGGQVYSKPVEFSLLIDVKEKPEETYALLGPLLERYRDILTRFTDTNSVRGAVTVVLSGARPLDQVRSSPVRWCAIDGRLADLESNPSPFLVYWVSESWRPTFSAFEEGRLTEADQVRLHQVVKKAHEQGRRIRFWGLQDQEYVWRALYSAGVDLINTDRLADLRRFLETQPR